MSGAKDTPHFDISAAVVRQLGDELVSDEVTAILELVKNAFDADASFARVVIETRHGPGDESQFKNATSFISIEDDGEGMSRDDVERGWLTISLSSKRAMKARGDKTRKGRTPLGDKGLGRLSTQRLGDHLDLITEREQDEHALRVSFSWSDFKDNVHLSSVPVSIEEQKRTRAKGTKLIIAGLRDLHVWKGGHQSALIKRLTQLIFPFGEVRPFRVFISVDGQKIDLETMVDAARKAAVATFDITYSNLALTVDGKLRLRKLLDDTDEGFERLLDDDDGEEFFVFLSERAKIPGLRRETDGWYIGFRATIGLGSLSAAQKIVIEGDLVPADPGPFSGKLEEFTLRGENRSGFPSLNDFTAFVKGHAGIRLFRDGFGVRPYGMDGNDWLNLGGGQTSGRSFYGLRPGNVIGFISISEEFNGKLKEKTDREGLIQNAYSQNFTILLKSAVLDINTAYNSVRRTFNEFRSKKGEEKGGFTSVAQSVAQMRSASTQVSAVRMARKQLDDRLSETKKAVEETEDRLAAPLFASKADEEARPLVDKVKHMLSDADYLMASLDNLLARAGHIEGFADYIEPKFAVLQEQLEEFTSLAALGMSAEALSHEMAHIAERLNTSAKAFGKKAAAAQNKEGVIFSEQILSGVSALRKQISHVSPALRFIRERREPVSVKEFLQEQATFHDSRDDSIQVGLSEDCADFAVKVSKGRLIQIIDNLVLNSVHWLRFAGVSDPVIFMRSSRPHIDLWDNGPGIDKSVEDTLFQPFVSRKENGRGLGLYICQQLLEPIGCDIRLMGARNSYGNRYIFRVDLSGALINE